MATMPEMKCIVEILTRHALPQSRISETETASIKKERATIRVCAMTTNPGPNCSPCPNCGPVWNWRIVPLGTKSTDGYRRVCAVCGSEGEKLNRRTNIIAHECLEKITKITRGKEQEEA